MADEDDEFMEELKKMRSAGGDGDGSDAVTSIPRPSPVPVNLNRISVSLVLDSLPSRSFAVTLISVVKGQDLFTFYSPEPVLAGVPARMVFSNGKSFRVKALSCVTQASNRVLSDSPTHSRYKVLARVLSRGNDGG